MRHFGVTFFLKLRLSCLWSNIVPFVAFGMVQLIKEEESGFESKKKSKCDLFFWFALEGIKVNSRLSG